MKPQLRYSKTVPPCLLSQTRTLRSTLLTNTVPVTFQGRLFFLFLEVLLNWLRVGVQWPQEIRLILLFVYTKRKGQKEQKNGEYTT